MSNFIDLTGAVFGRLLVLQYAGYEKGAQWVCECECGKQVKVRSDHLRYGRVHSCGCFKKEVTGKLAAERKKHGMWNTRLYSVWRGMKQRCSPSASPDNIDKYYQKGIRVCATWRESFEAFRDWALANGYRDDLTIDRLDSDKDYTPDNCRWATYSEQNKNRRRGRMNKHENKNHNPN